MRKRYQVAADGWLDGAYRRAGDAVEMEEAAAHYLVLNGQLVARDAGDAQPAAAKPAPGPERGPKRTAKEG
jgi:hypothetical protein